MERDEGRRFFSAIRQAAASLNRLVRGTYKDCGCAYEVESIDGELDGPYPHFHVDCPKREVQSTLQDLVLGPEEARRFRETGVRSPLRLAPAQAGMWVNGTHLTWRQLGVLFGRQSVPRPPRASLRSLL